MCKIKKMYVLLLPLSFLCVASFTSFTSNLNLPDNFTGLSVQERIQWLDSNGSQVTEYGTLVGKQRDVLSNYESKKTNYYRNEIGSKAVGISVTYNWSVNPDGTIETYNVSDFSMGFSLLRVLEFFVFRKMEMPETKTHLLCGWSQIVIQKITFPLQ